MIQGGCKEDAGDLVKGNIRINNWKRRRMRTNILMLSFKSIFYGHNTYVYTEYFFIFAILTWSFFFAYRRN